MKIGILLVGRATDDLVEKYGTYAEMLISLINSEEDVFEFKTFNILDSVFPESHQECDGWIVTGSPHGVYEDHDWIPTVSQLIIEIYRAQLPIFGVCFGHQLIAQALGGHVEKSIKGWGLGLHTYEINNKTELALKNKDFIKTAEDVHKLKHKISILGLQKGYVIATDYENNLKEGNYTLQEDFEKILQMITTYIVTL